MATEQTFRAFVQVLAPVSDLTTFRQLVATQFRELTQSRAAVLATPHASDGAFWTEADAAPDWPDPTPICSASGPLARWLRANEEALVLPDQPGVVRYLAETERQALVSHGVSVCIPCVTSSRLTAIVLAAGAPTRPLRADRDLLMRCAAYAAAAWVALMEQQAARERAAAAAHAQQLAIAGQLAAAIAHEVRNPLATIRSSVQLAADSAENWPQRTTLLQHVVGEVDRINRTLSAMVGFSRPQPLELSTLDLGSLVDQVLVLVQPYVDHQHLSLTRSTSAAPVRVRADGRLLQQVLLNVFLNACQATDSGGELTIAVETAPGQAVIRVHDTGRGIRPDQLAHVFEPYFTTKATGSGLGLAICRDLMMRHGGQIVLESDVGIGTTVTLTLPALEPA